MANIARPIVLDKAERHELKRLERSRSAPAGMSRRARAVLLLAQEKSGVEVARLTGYTSVQISRIRRRFAEERLDGLAERRHTGRPKTITPRQIARVVALTLKPPPKGLSHWTSREMEAKTQLSHTTICRIWKAHNLKPHQVRTFKFSTDPNAEEKILDVVGLYLNPPDNAVVLCLDEKTQIQALNRTQPLLPLRPGLPARQTHDYKRNGVVSLFAALEIASGRVVGECRERHTGADFLRFLKRVSRAFRKRDLHVVLDNSSIHSTPAVQEWLEKNPRVHFHFTPTGASWINLVEAWFSILTRKSIRRGSFDTVRQLVRHIHHYLIHWNEDPIPFVWTKEPEDVIRKAVRR
ncbi:MAG: IS630 family transposase [Planctomycetota bacterium]